MNAMATVSVDRIFLESTRGLTPSEIDRKLGLAAGEARRLMTLIWALETAAYEGKVDKMGARRIESRLRAMRETANITAGNTSDDEARRRRELDMWVNSIVNECEEEEHRANREAQYSL